MRDATLGFHGLGVTGDLIQGIKKMGPTLNCTSNRSREIELGTIAKKSWGIRSSGSIRAI